MSRFRTLLGGAVSENGAKKERRPPAETTKRLSAGFRRAHPGVPWRRIAGMRDRLIHGHDDVDLNQVRKAVDSDIPALLAHLEPLSRSP